MLEIKDLTIIVNNKVIINNLNMVVNNNDKIAIIGEEGNGKSTLLKCINNTNEVDYAIISGYINHKNNKIGYLDQNINEEFLNKSVKQYLFDNEEDFDYYLNEIYQVINQLKLNDKILEINKIKFLSGGEKVKIQLLKILLENNDILLLDEPTNDLDIETLIWLESFIINCNKPILYISHDETLLSKTANAILHIELIKRKSEAKHTFIKTTYDNYIEERLSLIAKQTQISKKEHSNHKKQMEKWNQIMQKVEYRQATISRSDPHGGQLLKKKMKSIKAQEKRLKNKELTEMPDYEESINIFFNEINIPNKKEILDLFIPKLSVNSKVLAQNIKLNIKGPKHIVIVGKNGIGKTTLLKEIYRILQTRTDIKVGYMPQDYNDILSHYRTPLEFLNSNNLIEPYILRNKMGNINFSNEEMLGDINELSGGSKAKLLLLKLIVDESNVLILDEPTRNVSPLSNPVIRNILKEFKGTIISVSHDRKYMAEVCDQIYELTKDGLNIQN